MGQYSFVDTGPTTVGSNEAVITEGLTFGDFNSHSQGWWLIDRQAPSPGEKTITETIPYSQGVLDFSILGDDRFFNNRDVTYQIKKINEDYADRKIIENMLKNKLMPLGIQVIKDSHDGGLHWLGKCKSVSVSDDAKNRTLTATVVFDCYPFAISDNPEGSDIWDDVFFPDWVFQDTSYTVNGTRSINLMNIGAHTVDVEIIVTGSITVTGAFGSMDLTAGTYTDTPLAISRGDNALTLKGSGTVEFKFYKEVMI